MIVKKISEDIYEIYEVVNMKNTADEDVEVLQLVGRNSLLQLRSEKEILEKQLEQINEKLNLIIK